VYQLDTVLELINNLDHREALRKFAPAWAIVVVNSALEIEAVERYKYEPKVNEEKALMSKHVGCAYFFTHPGMYDSLEKLSEKIATFKEAFLVQESWPNSI
jgi:hypothetical protein